MKKIKPGNTRGCCGECWNSKFALGSRVKDGICGLACECHTKMGRCLSYDEQMLQTKKKLDPFEEIERRMKLDGVSQEEIDYWLRGKDRTK